MVRLVLFDIDGTLIRTGGAGVKSFERAFETEFNISNGTSRIKFSGRTDTGIAREMFVQHGVAPTPANFRRFFDAYVFWLDHMLSQGQGGTLPGVWEFIRDLRSMPETPMMRPSAS